MTQIQLDRPGLEGVIAAETSLSKVDGERGRLVLRGHDIETLGAGLAHGRLVGFDRLDGLRDALEAPDGMDALRIAVAHLADVSDATLAGTFAVFAAGWERARRGLPPLAPDPGLRHAADYLRMIEGEEVSPARVDGLDAYLVTVADHGMNASTFTARVVASTESDPVSAVVAAIGALKGPRHGGAPGPVLDMLDAIARPERALGWLRREIEARRRIMGMGHRVYRVRDPRAAVLERAIAVLERSGLRGARLELAHAIERAAEGLLRERYPDRPLQANVEFYTALLLDALGLPRRLFTPTFAVARVAGWLAHYHEQAATGRLIRPLARYVGPLPATAA
jgi:citrate synthase